MKRNVGYLVFVLLCFFQTGYSATSSKIESISIMFPMGDTDLRVWKNGDTLIFYNTSGRHSIIKKGVFNTAELYKKIQLYLQPNIPSEKWPYPKAQAGMVLIRFIDKSEESFLIFNPQEWTNKLFNIARKNIISEVPY